MKDKKKLLVGIWIILVSGLLIWFIFYFAKRWFTPNARANYYNLENLNYIKNYLKNNYDKNLPMPEWDVVFLDKNLRPVVVSNEKNVLAQNQNIYIIQWNTCNINIGQWDYDKKKYDTRFSNNKTKKCFSYSITRDRKYFQLWTVLHKNGKYVAYLDWNFSGNITKDYQSENIVDNNSDKYLPYYPWFNDTIYLQAIQWQAEIKVNYDFNPYKIKKEKDGKMFLPVSKDLDLNFEGKDFVYKIIYPNWNIQFVAPNGNDKLSFVIKKFEYDNINTKLLIKDFVWKIWNIFVSNGEDSDNRFYDNKGFLYEIFLWNTNFLVDDDITAVFLTSWKTKYSRLNYEYVFDTEKDFRWIDKKWSYIWLEKEWFNKYIENLFSFSILINTNINKVKKTTLSETEKIQNNYLKYILQNNKSISYEKSYLLTWNNFKYSINIFKWFFDEWFTSKIYLYIEKNDKSDFSIKDLFSSICSNKNIISLSSASWFFNFDNVKKTIELDKNIYNIIPQDYIIFFYSPTSKLLWISYFDKETWKVFYEKDLSKLKKNSNTPNWFILICN